MTFNKLKKLSILLFVMVLSPLAGADKLEANFQDSYVVDGITYTLKLKKTFVQLGYDYGQKLNFSVFVNGKFIFADIDEGGTALGCRQPLTAPKDVNPIERLVLNGKPAGWQLNVHETCGTQSLTKGVLILPPSETQIWNPSKKQNHFFRDPDHYLMKTFISNYKGVYVRPSADNDGIEVWYSKYFSCGDYSKNFPVPLMQVIGKNHKIPADVEKWPKEWSHPGFQIVFLAAMADKNLALLQTSKKLLDEKNVSKDSCIAEGVPRTQQKLDEIIQSIKVLDENKVSQYYGQPLS